MPGVSSGLNHSFDIQACGLIRSPRSASSSWRSFRHRSSQVPTMVTEAVQLLAARDGDAKAIAGGQSLVPMLAFRLAQPTLLVDLRKLADLRGIRISAKGVTLGAMVRWRDIEDDERLDTAHPLLKAAIAHVAHYQVRNRGTVGGSLAHADPAAEMPGIAMTCDAEIAVVGRSGAHVIQAADFFQGALTSARPLKVHPAGSLMSVRFRVNGQEVEVEVEPRLTLADCLRHHLRLTGTHVGCEHGVCGACTVIVDGAAVRSCLMLAVQAEGAEVITVEGLSNDADLTPLQKSFRRHHALQCGFCTPGMITTAHALLSEEPDCDAARVREVLSGNLCRCTGYIPIVEAVLDARAAYQPKGRDRSGDRA